MTRVPCQMPMAAGLNAGGSFVLHPTFGKVQKLGRGAPCVWWADGDIDGVPLCFVHRCAVQAGLRQLGEAQSEAAE